MKEAEEQKNKEDEEKKSEEEERKIEEEDNKATAPSTSLTLATLNNLDDDDQIELTSSLNKIISQKKQVMSLQNTLMDVIDKL